MSADIRYLALPATSAAIIDNNDNPKVSLVGVSKETVDCSIVKGYTTKVDVRSYPYVCLRTTEGRFVYFQASAYNVDGVKLSHLRISG